MPSFSKMGVWNTGYFRAYSSWLLRNRREISKRVGVINAEIERIGDVTVVYAEERLPDGSVRRTEERVGFRVTPGSSLGKLVRAYVANGGDPWNISSFLKPDSTEVVGLDENGQPVVVERYPYGGVAAPMSANPNEPLAEGGSSGFTSHPGGFIRMDGYYPARQGGRTDPGAYSHDAVVRHMHHMREWAKQDIDERLRRIEWQIVKLCDLREQLVKERDEVLVQAFGGALTGVPALDPERFDPAFMVQNLVQEMSDLVFAKDEVGNTIFSPNENVPRLRFALVDLPSEMNRDLLG